MVQGTSIWKSKTAVLHVNRSATKARPRVHPVYYGTGVGATRSTAYQITTMYAAIARNSRANPKQDNRRRVDRQMAPS
ncbi:hypothetical protein LZ32DRAFT_85492 [Colletotrichum eremochloae]|nr:hypothetical protein LZ32DRAFT_85492 [Colletotrichum eremochloae]